MNYLCVLGYNWLDSVERLPFNWWLYRHRVKGGTENRCLTLIEFADECCFDNTTCEFILTSGKPAGSSRPLTLAEEMAKFIHNNSNGIFDPTPTPIGWGTLAEIRGAILRIGSHSSMYKNVVPHVFICTNPGHLPRVRMYWWALAPKDWRVTFIPAKNQSFTKMEWLQEAGKVMRDIYRIATGKIKRTET